MEGYCSLTGVTGLTGPSDRSDRSRPENCSKQKKQERSYVNKGTSQFICFIGIFWGHVLQTVRESSTILIKYLFMCFLTNLLK